MMKDKKTSGTFNTLMDMAREDDGSDITDYLDVTSSDLQLDTSVYFRKKYIHLLKLIPTV